MTLAEFLLARIAEDEALARSAIGRRAARDDYSWEVSLIRMHVWGEPEPDAVILSGNKPLLTVEAEYAGVDTIEYLVTFDPARVLAECEAKRRIVEQYAEYLSTVRSYRSPRWSDAMNEQDKENARQAEARHRVAEDVARLLALPYVDHPDYRQEWRP